MFTLENLFIPVSMSVIIIIFVIFLCIQSALNKKSHEALLKKFIKSQESLLENAAAKLSDNLTQYTDNVLLSKINSNYMTLITEDLLPSVNDAARIITELSDRVVQKQETGMIEIAEKMADLLASKTRDYINEEEVIFSSIKETVFDFSQALSAVTEKVKMLSENYSSVYDNANIISDKVSNTADLLGNRLVNLSDAIDKNIQLMNLTQESINKINDTVASLTKTTTDIQALAGDVTAKFSDVAADLSNTTANEFKKITSGAENYSNLFLQNIAKFSDIFEGHISNLQTITRQLNNNVSSFKNDVDLSTDRFELGMEKSVSAVLSELDNSLAEIVNRLIDVTSSIKEAADALPRAVNAMKV